LPAKAPPHTPLHIWGSLQRSLRPLAGFWRHTSKGGEGAGAKGGPSGEEERGKEKGKGKEGKEKAEESVPLALTLQFDH